MRFPASEKIRLQKRYGPWALVTGASSGIGLEIATRLAEAGLHLLVVARNEAQLNTLAAKWRNDYQVKVQVCAADLGQPAGIAATLAASQGLDIGLLVAAAGFGTSGSFLASDLDAERAMLAVNCGAVLALTQHFSIRFAGQRRGGIILLSSMVGFQGTPFAAHYAATKAYVQSLGEALAFELRPMGVDVLAAAPGPVKSGFEARANMHMGMALTPEDVGVPILRALGRKGTVLPGWLTKLLVYSLRTVPRWAKVRIMAKVMRGMAKSMA
jgi:uncharacterized protein